MFERRGVFLQQDGSYRWEIKLPGFMGGHADYDHWEKDRLASMAANLRGGILLDVGAELGWMSIIFSLMGCDVCLFEPVAELWPTIRQIWEANRESWHFPRATVLAFVGKSERGQDPTRINNDVRLRWPRETQLEPLTDFDSWGHLHAEPRAPQVTLDHWTERWGIKPSALSIDVEGAELWVLMGAQELLKKIRPLVWLSVHPGKRLMKFDSTRVGLLRLMERLDYRRQYLGVDHEEHWFFYPVETNVALVEQPWGSQALRDLSFDDRFPDWRDTMPTRGQYWMQEANARQ